MAIRKIRYIGDEILKKKCIILKISMCKGEERYGNTGRIEKPA